MPHPALSLFFWSLLAAAGQLLDPGPLAAFCGLLFACAAIVAPRRMWLLLRRSRFLLLALLILFAFFTPGERVFEQFLWLPLTGEGLQLAAVQLGRVLSVIALVALLMETIATADLVQALATLAAPIRLAGGEPERFAVRLSLVLWMVAEARPPRWQELLQAPSPGERIETIEISHHPFTAQDRLLLGSAIMAVVLWLILSA